jgi:hypothetical protein
MKNIKNINKKGFLKKVFIKLCRMMGYEIIDQSNFYFPVSNKNIDDNLSIAGDKSISIPLGETKIKRKVISLDIVIKSCTSVNLVSQNKKRIFEKEKSEYTFRTIRSILNSLNFNKVIFDKINLKLTIIDHNSKRDDLILIEEMLKKSLINYEIINLNVNEFENIKTLKKNNIRIEENMRATMASILKSFIVSKKYSSDLVYFVEDDYIHKKECLGEMVLTYEKIATELNRELFLCPIDYPYLYNKPNATNIFIGNKFHWRTVNESLLTFMTSKTMIDKYWDKLVQMSEVEHSPFETPLHNIYENEICLSPISSLAMHCTNINSVFGISPNIDIKKIWEDSKF